MTEQLNTKNDGILNNIIAASANTELQTTEDVYDVSGNKLLAKGYKITPSIRSKMLGRVLKKPIETSIHAQSCLASKDIAQTARELINQDSLLAVFVPDIEAEVSALSVLPLDPLAATLLTVMRDGESNQLNHAIWVTLVARGIARKMALGRHAMISLSMAGLLHDVGKLYISVPSDYLLSVSDWRKVMSHPVIGSNIVELYMNYPSEVASAILEHHERCDGTGYPKKINVNDCSVNGQILMVAEAFADIFKSRGRIQNVVVAFQIASGIYPSKPLAALNSMLNTITFTHAEVDKDALVERLTRKVKTLNAVQLKLNGILNVNEDTTLIVEAVSHLKFRVDKLLQTVYAAGLQYYLEDSHWADVKENQEALLEMEIMTGEIKWQIFDILRDSTFRLLDFNEKLPANIASITEELA